VLRAFASNAAPSPLMSALVNCGPPLILAQGKPSSEDRETMNKPERGAILRPNLHAEDFYSWAMETARAVREGRLGEVDWDAVAEELEDMARSEKRELTNRLTVLLTHLLKWRHQPGRRTRSWTLTILEQRRRVQDIRDDNPGLKSVEAAILASAYRVAVLRAARQTDAELAIFPPTCPWGWTEILDEHFLPTEVA
jgi:hypothetical protein